MNTVKSKIVLLILIFIVGLGGYVRFHRLGTTPIAINWDEAAVGYNAWTMSQTARDEWGKVLPTTFQSFGEFKQPILVYVTAPFVAALGLTELAVRFPVALFGVLNILLIFFLSRELFKKDEVGISAALFFAISPYDIQFSRFSHELNIVLFFFMLGFLLFQIGLRNKKYLIPLSFVSFGVCFLTYNAAKVVVPVFLVALIITHYKEVLKFKKYFLIALIVPLLIGALILKDRELLGLSRYKEVSSDPNQATRVEKYLSHLNYKYLFETGDPNTRHSIQTVGEFYKSDFVLISVGVIALLYGIIKRRKEYFLVSLWMLLGPLPAVLGTEMPHSGRAMFMLGSFQIAEAVGVGAVLTILRNKYLKSIAIVALLIINFKFFVPYVTDYFQKYDNQYAIEWQYGMKEIVNYVKDSGDKYDEVFMTDTFNQPYIFYLFYLKYPLKPYLRTVHRNTGLSRPSNLVLSFDKYNFGNWDPIESPPRPGVLYIVKPAHYTGLRYINSFETVKKIQYPNGTDAFYLVTAKNGEEK